MLGTRVHNFSLKCLHVHDPRQYEEPYVEEQRELELAVGGYPNAHFSPSPVIVPRCDCFPQQPRAASPTGSA